MSDTIFTKESWYRFLEWACQLVALGILIYGGSVWEFSKAGDWAAFTKTLPLPAILLMMSAFFHALCSTAMSPFIESLVVVYKSSGFTGVHFAVFMAFLFVALLAGAMKSDPLKDVCKILVGVFLGVPRAKNPEKPSAGD